MPAEECRSCRKEIHWCEKDPVELNDKGQPKTIPVDADTVGKIENGKIEVWSEQIPTDGGERLFALKFRYITIAQPFNPEHKMAVNHFATCPQAGQWRR